MDPELGIALQPNSQSLWKMIQQLSAYNEEVSKSIIQQQQNKQAANVRTSYCLLHSRHRLLEALAADLAVIYGAIAWSDQLSEPTS